MFMQVYPEDNQTGAQRLKDFMVLGVDARAQALQVLRMHLPDTLAQRIEAGHLAFINEIRVCTVLFIGFPSLKASQTCAFDSALRSHT